VSLPQFLGQLVMHRPLPFGPGPDVLLQATAMTNATADRITAHRPRPMIASTMMVMQ
jgi:hypothetical protein